MENTNLASKLIVLTKTADLEEVEEMYINFNMAMSYFDEAIDNCNDEAIENAIAELKVKIQELAIEPEPVYIPIEENEIPFPIAEEQEEASSSEVPES